eukprot:6625826-Pyramimonas_sp.AAC.1
MRRAGEQILIDQFMQRTTDALGTSGLLFRSPARSAKRTMRRASGARPATRQDDQSEAGPAGA